MIIDKELAKALFNEIWELTGKGICILLVAWFICAYPAFVIIISVGISVLYVDVTAEYVEIKMENLEIGKPGIAAV